METQKDIKNKKPRLKGIVKRVVRENKSAVIPMFILAFFSVLSVAFSLLGPYLLGNATDAIYKWWKAFKAGSSIPMDFGTINESLLWFLYMSLGSALVAIIIGVFMNNITSHRFTYGHRIKISDKLKRTPVKYIDSTPHGEILSRMLEDVSELGSTMHNILITLSNGVVQVLGMTIVLFWINPIMAGLVILFIPLNIFIASRISIKCEKAFLSSKTQNGNLNSFIQENYTSHSVIKAFGLEDKSLEKFSKVNDEVYRSSIKGYYYAGLIQPVIWLINNFSYVLIGITGAIMVINGNMNYLPYDVLKISVGDIAAIIMYSLFINQPITQIAYIMGQFQRTKVSVSRIYEVMDAEEMKPEVKNAELKNVQGDVVFDNVNFSYNPASPLIQNFSIDVKSGQRVAIVGPTGAGKTTLVNLLMRFYDLDSGKICLDGKDIASMPREKVRNAVGMVLQDTWLFTGTIFENISYGANGVSAEEVKAAAKAARADNFILTLPKGYETEINEDASNISQGQKQLITIARAFLAHSNILILDEATSNVDTRTEVLIQKAMDELMHNKTCFIIAHRLSTIINADVIVVMNDGKVVETGSHKELLERGGFYSELYNSQYSSIE